MRRSSRRRRFVAALAGFGAVAGSVCSISPIASPAHAQDTVSAKPGQEYIDRLNALVYAVSEEERAYRIYFEAYEKLDIADERMAAATSALHPSDADFADAIGWAGEPSQQESVAILLTDNAKGYNATERQAFGLPYGSDAVSDDMLAYDFAAYFSDGHLYDRDLAYALPYRSLMALLRAEAFRRAEEQDTAGAVEAILGFNRMARQLCEQHFLQEKVTAMQMLAGTLTETRDFVWVYRDRLSIDDLRELALGIERLACERVTLPEGERVVGEQLLGQIFGDNNWPDENRLPDTMAHFESADAPLARFQAVAKWKQVVNDHVTRVEAEEAFDEIVRNWRYRWKLPIHDPALQDDPQYTRFDDVKYAAVKANLGRIHVLFDHRLRLLAEQHGTACAAGLVAFIKREGGQLTPGELTKSTFVPQRLAQIQPSYVPSYDSLQDPYGDEGDLLRYTMIQKRDRRFKTQGYELMTPEGVVFLPEFWPLLYSVGPDGSDDAAAKHAAAPAEGETADIVYFPTVELIARELKAKRGGGKATETGAPSGHEGGDEDQEPLEVDQLPAEGDDDEGDMGG